MGIILNAVVLYILVSTLGDSSDDSTRWKVLVIVVALVAIEGALSSRITHIVESLGLVILTTTGIALALVTWCKLSRPAAIKIAAIFLGFRIVLAVGAIWLISRAARTAA
jgi:hypothetical protein